MVRVVVDRVAEGIAVEGLVGSYSVVVAGIVAVVGRVVVDSIGFDQARSGRTVVEVVAA